jgi:hypothetical protein
VRSGLVWAGLVVVLATGCHHGRSGWSPKPGAPTDAGRTTCTAAHLRVAPLLDLTPATGLNPEAIRIMNMGPRCVLSGYPIVRFTDRAGAAIAFRVSHTGDQMVTADHPRRVVVPRGGAAWVVLDKYRCDLGNRARVGEIELQLAGAERIGTVEPESAGWAFCGRGDPGSTVHVSPFEPRLLAALRRH